MANPKLVVSALIVIGGGLLFWAWRIGGGDTFLQALLIELGVGVFLFGLLWWIERRLERQIESQITPLKEKVKNLRTDLDSFQVFAEGQGQVVSDDFQKGLAEADKKRADLIGAATTDPGFQPIKDMLIAAKDNRWIHPNGVRVALPGRTQYIRFVPAPVNQLYINVKIEAANQHLLKQRRWGKDETRSGFFVKLLDDLDDLHGGSYPRDNLVPKDVLEALIATVDVGFRSVTQQADITPGITQLIELPNDQFALTMTHLYCLYNSFKADSQALAEKEPPLDDLRSEYAWRDERKLVEAWAAASELFSPT